jgi:hypothetical protein
LSWKPHVRRASAAEGAVGPAQRSHRAGKRAAGVVGPAQRSHRAGKRAAGVVGGISSAG